MADAALLAARLWDEAVPARLRGDVARDAGVAGEALLRLRLALERQVAGGAAGFEFGVCGGERAGAGHALDDGFGVGSSRNEQAGEEEAQEPAHQYACAM